MRPDNRTLIAMLVAVVAITGIGGAYFLLTPTASSPPTTLPIHAGTTFSFNDTVRWAAYFNVSVDGARLVGAWTAVDGLGYASLWVVNGTVAKPPITMYRCPALSHWDEFNGSVDTPVNSGPHTLYWGACFGASQTVVTQTIRVIPWSSP